MCRASLISTPSGRLPQKQFMNKDTGCTVSPDFFDWYSANLKKCLLRQIFRAPADSQKHFSAPQCAHIIQRFMSRVTVLSLLFGFCAACMTSYRREMPPDGLDRMPFGTPQGVSSFCQVGSPGFQMKSTEEEDSALLFTYTNRPCGTTRSSNSCPHHLFKRQVVAEVRNVYKHKTQSRPFEELLASDIVKAESSGEDPRATGGLVSNLPHPRVNKTKQHTRKFHRNISRTYGSTGP